MIYIYNLYIGMHACMLLPDSKSVHSVHTGSLSSL